MDHLQKCMYMYDNISPFASRAIRLFVPVQDLLLYSRIKLPDTAHVMKFNPVFKKCISIENVLT